jgi:hypothetical protein
MFTIQFVDDNVGVTYFNHEESHIFFLYIFFARLEEYYEVYRRFPHQMQIYL